ncbi:alpha-(1,3)-fucosyltransferase C [Aplysia californica]|uniref:Fucosyltransferase n=1 Tax=Aplysia californica TaxID=6500 RepID=A0ABM0JZM8_APLCA|nr:alpha-(1,3)-fucosyltransferase C [Aplysia californica]
MRSWLLYTKEPPVFQRFDHLLRRDFLNAFNWTRTVFPDSTFKGVYGVLKERPLPKKDYGKKRGCLCSKIFYLSFENSLCEEYVTEKFFNIFEEVDVIPVVRGGARYEKLLPPGSFINAKDFDSAEQLGKYLRVLANDKTKYISMLKKKNRYTLGEYPKQKFPCEICKALNLGEPKNVYRDVYGWMWSHCWEPLDV